MKRKIFFLAVFLSFSHIALAQYFKTSVSLIGVANFASYNFLEQEGNFIEKKGHANLGIGGNIAYYLDGSKKLFLQIGFRLTFLKSGVTANHTVPGIAVPAAYWQFEYTQYSVPLYFGKTLIPFRNSPFYLDVFAGGSLGIIETSGFGYGTRIQKTQDNDEWVGAGVNGPRTLYNFDSKFCPTLDVGIGFPIIPSFPRLNINILFSHNLAAATPVQKDGFVANATQNISQVFYFRMNNKFNSVLFSLNYSFGKKWRKNIGHSKSNPNDCPNVSK